LGAEPVEHTVIDRWMISRLRETIGEVDAALRRLLALASGSR